MRLKFTYKRLAFFLSFVISVFTNAQDYQNTSEAQLSSSKIDSLNLKITILKHSLPGSKDDLAKYYRMKDNIELTEFYIEYEKLVLMENLEKAKLLVNKKLNDAYSTSREDRVEIFTAYKKDIDKKIKGQRIKYQHFFDSPKDLKKQLRPFYKSNDKVCLQKAIYITSSALNYAKSKNLKKAASHIMPYKLKAEALLYDINCSYDLKKLTKKKKKFEKLFQPLIVSENPDDFQEVKYLIDDCKYYSNRMDTKLGYNYFLRKENIINTKLMKIEEKLALDGKLENDKLLVSKLIMPMDSVNENGIYKFSDKIVVVGKYNPATMFNDGTVFTDDRVNQGMAIIEADKMLMDYINNKVEKIRKNNKKVVHTYMIPYVLDGKYQWFLNLNVEGDRQFRVAYSFVGSKELTKKLLEEYLRPIKFKEIGY